MGYRNGKHGRNGKASYGNYTAIRGARCLHLAPYNPTVPLRSPTAVLLKKDGLAVLTVTSVRLVYPYRSPF